MSISCPGRLSFSGDIPSVVSRARVGTRPQPLPPRRMQRSSSKLGQLRHSASSLRSLQRRTVTSRSPDTFCSHDAGTGRNDELLGSLHGSIEETTQSRVQHELDVAMKGGLAVLDRAANWAHAKPIWKRRVPPLGVPQLSIEKILQDPQDILDDEIFNTELGDQILPKGSFLEVRRSAHIKSTPFSFVHDSECVGVVE